MKRAISVTSMQMLGVAVLATVATSLVGGVLPANALDITKDTKDYVVPAEGSTENLVVKSGSDVTITLDGNLTVTGSDAIYVEEGATVTINGNGMVTTTDKGKAPLHNNGGTVVIESGHIYKDEGCTDATVDAGTGMCESGATQYYAIFNERGSLTINGGTVEIANYERTIAGASLINNRTYTGNNKQATLIINGGTLIGGVVNVKNELGSNTIINGGTFKGATTSSLHNMNTMTINDGEFSMLNPDEYGLISTGEGNSAGAPVPSSGEVTINGGEFNATYLFEDWTTAEEYKPVKIAPVIKGGEFSIEHMCIDSVAESSALRTAEVTGGIFVDGVELPILPEGYAKYSIGDDKYVVAETIDFDTTDATLDNMTVSGSFNIADLNLPELVKQYGVFTADGDVLTVDNGVVVANKAGNGTLTVAFDGKAKTYAVTVEELPELTPPTTTTEENNEETEIAVPNTGAKVVGLFAVVMGAVVAIAVALRAAANATSRR